MHGIDTSPEAVERMLGHVSRCACAECLRTDRDVHQTIRALVDEVEMLRAAVDRAADREESALRRATHINWWSR